MNKVDIRIKVEHEITPLRRAEMTYPECGHRIEIYIPKGLLTRMICILNLIEISKKRVFVYLAIFFANKRKIILLF